MTKISPKSIWSPKEALEQVRAALPDYGYAERFKVDPKLITKLNDAIEDCGNNKIDLDLINELLAEAANTLPGAWAHTKDGVGDYFMSALNHARMQIGKDILANVLNDLGFVQASSWENHGNNWDYTKIVFGFKVLAVGVSTGGVVSFDGDPFTGYPKREMNVSYSEIKQSIFDKYDGLENVLKNFTGKIDNNYVDAVHGLLLDAGFSYENSSFTQVSGKYKTYVDYFDDNPSLKDVFQVRVFSDNEKISESIFPASKFEYPADLAQKLNDFKFLGHGQFNGKILSIEGEIVTQKVGRYNTEVQRHELRDLTGDLKVGDVVNIGYKNGKGSVTGLEKTGISR